MGNGPKVRLPGRLCSFSDMGRMPHSERASPSSGTAAPRILHIPRQEKPAASGQSPQSRSREANHTLSRHTPGGQPPSSGTAAPRILHIPRQEKTCGKRAKPADAATWRPALHPLSQTAPRHPRYASTTINSPVSSAVCTSSSIFSSRFFSCLRITFRFGLVTGCFATKMVQQSS